MDKKENDFIRFLSEFPRERISVQLLDWSSFLTDFESLVSHVILPWVEDEDLLLKVLDEWVHQSIFFIVKGPSLLEWVQKCTFQNVYLILDADTIELEHFVSIFHSTLKSDRQDGLIPTTVTDEQGIAL